MLLRGSNELTNKSDFSRIGLPLLQSNLTSECNAKCNCQQEFYVPSCGTDGLTYFSPCHAACNIEKTSNLTTDKVS